MSIGVVAVERQHRGDPGATVDSAGRPAPAAAGSRATPAGSPVRNEATNETKNGRLTSSHAIPAVARYSHHRASEVA